MKAPAKQAEPMTNHRREAQRLKRERVEALLSESRRQLPSWHFLAPWEAERFIEGDQRQQMTLPGMEANR
jgi:hypothetical protein